MCRAAFLPCPVAAGFPLLLHTNLATSLFFLATSGEEADEEEGVVLSEEEELLLLLLLPLPLSLLLLASVALVDFLNLWIFQLKPIASKRCTCLSVSAFSPRLFGYNCPSRSLYRVRCVRHQLERTLLVTGTVQCPFRSRNSLSSP